MNSPLSSWSLLNRLTLGVVLLSTLGFVASDIAAQSMLRSFLTHEVDNELLSIAGGSIPRLERAGIESDEDNFGERKDHEGRQTQPAPLRNVPSATSVTLLGPAGVVLGQIGGDLNATEITSYLTGITPAKVAEYGDRPFTIEAPGSDFRVISRALPSGLGSVVVAQSMENIDRTLRRLQGLFVLIGLAMIFFIALASRKVIKVGLKPLANVEETAERIAEGDLTARLPDVKPNTEVGRLVNTLNTMLGRIEESFAARVESESKLRRFVADASHELRTPITAIRGFAELHRQGAVAGEEKTKELIGRIENESKRMGSLVEDLLLLARLDQSREMKSDPVNLSKLVADAVESARAAGPNHVVNFENSSEDIYTLGDNDRIHQVVANLLANARTHTPAGTVIDVTVKQDLDGVRIRIADNGPGLSAADQERIFERFYRADASRVRTDGEGTGLGLSIVDAVMRAHAGQVSVESEIGKGAAFTLFFPLES
ncbi:MAG: HAMP domain-containing protein [Actinobacteria bacterium]|uniref:histidine kinase n=1 Tax=freshwater metagenome TaxID=449393 RepID=A0A6J7KR41_9ZZZZ|nr:HAMP domain-containing protein [Actinomycetota bacterium]